jgi:hypothetical protein
LLVEIISSAVEQREILWQPDLGGSLGGSFKSFYCEADTQLVEYGDDGISALPSATPVPTLSSATSCIHMEAILSVLLSASFQAERTAQGYLRVPTEIPDPLPHKYLSECHLK